MRCCSAGPSASCAEPGASLPRPSRLAQLLQQNFCRFPAPLPSVVVRHGKEPKMRRLGIAVVAALLIGACARAAAPANAERTIFIEMSDVPFTPEPITVPAGEKVTLSFKNMG